LVLVFTGNLAKKNIPNTMLSGRAIKTEIVERYRWVLCGLFPLLVGRTRL
jgi:hypothetical protein